MSIILRIKDCIDNQEKYVAVMAALPDKELAKKLDLVHIQMEIAEQNKNFEAIELLEIWRLQIIEARIYKADNKIPDQPSEIELAIADIETIISKTEERVDRLNEISANLQNIKTKSTKKLEDNENQLSLF